MQMMDEHRFQEAQRMVREHLDEEFKRNKAITDQVAEIRDLVELAINALQDHAPTLSAVIAKKAEKVFGKP